MSANQSQIEYWSGPGGKRWVQQQVVLDRSLGPFGDAALLRASVRAGESVLDVGCGCGDSTLALAALVTETGTVCGVDVSGAMLELARARAADLPHVELVQADAAEHRFDSRFDLVFSRFGVMFFADPVAAFANLHTALSANGRLAFVCWRALADNPWATVPLEAVRAVVTEAPTFIAADAPGPYAFADAAKVERILGSAGFRDIELERFDADMEFSTSGLENAVDYAVYAGPASRLLIGATPDVVARAREQIASALAPHCVDGRTALPGSSWLVTARG
jgi:SAM-dependent methyltransferase